MLRHAVLLVQVDVSNVAIEFPSLARAQSFYDSPEYVTARSRRAGAGDARFVVVEGVE